MEKENRTIQLHFFVTEQEYKRIKEGMTFAHIRGLSTYLRKMAINGYIIHVDLSEIQKLTSLLGICSNNLNQYARKANETDCIYMADIEDLRERLNEIKFSKEYGNTVYDVLADFSVEGKETVLNQFKKIILSNKH